MYAHHYLAIGFKLFAIWLGLYSSHKLAYLLENILYGTVQGIEASLLYSAFLYLTPFIVVALLWKFPITLAKAIIPTNADLKPNPLSPKAFAGVLISLLGLFFLYRASMDSLYWLTILSFSENYGSFANYTTESKAAMVTTVLEFIAALLFLIKTKQISEWVSAKAL